MAPCDSFHHKKKTVVLIHPIACFCWKGGRSAGGDSKRFKEEPEPDAQQTDAAEVDADAPRQESPEREAVAAEPPAETAAHDDDPWGKWKGGEEGGEPTSPIEAPAEKDGGWVFLGDGLSRWCCS